MNVGRAHESGRFWANNAWLVRATMTFTVTRAAGTLASTLRARATTGAVRALLIAVPACLSMITGSSRWIRV